MHEQEPIIIPTDYAEHSHEHPFCYDGSCPCHEDASLISDVAQAVQDGLLTADEATNIVRGRTV